MAKVPKGAPWVVAHDATAGNLAYAMECLRCGTIQRVVTPMSVNCYVALGKAFDREHRGCKPADAGDKETNP